MGTTSPNGVWRPGDGEPIDWHITPTIVAAAAANAASGRTDGVPGPRLFRAANITEAAQVKASQVRVGDQIYRGDTRWIEELGNEGWKIVQTFQGIQYTSSWDYAIHGLGYSSGDPRVWTYWVNGDQVTIQGAIRFQGGPPTHGNLVRLDVPDELPMRETAENLGILGVAEAIVGGSASRMGMIAGMYATFSDGNGSGPIYPTVSFLTGSTSTPMTNTSPFSWPTNSSLAVIYSYLT